MKYLFLSIALALMLPIAVQAQVNAMLDISINAIPTDPLPGQTVKLNVVSFSANLNQTNVVWKYNDSTIASGVGKTSISLTAPASGTTAVITATAASTGLSQNTATFILRPAGVDVIWEAYDSYTPPFYKGKAMPATNAIIRAMAIPQSSAPKQLAYTWSRNGSAAASSSGFQRNSFIFKNDTLSASERIAVSATGGNYSGRSEIVVTPIDPGITAYKKIEGFIDFSRGYLSQIPVDQPGVVLRFEPYFFSYKTSIVNDLLYDITNSGNPVIGDTGPNELRLSRPENGGSSPLRVSITTVEYSLQNALQNFIVAFQ